MQKNQQQQPDNDDALLFQEIAEGNDEKILQSLLQTCPARVHARRQPSLETPLIWATLHQNTNAVRILLKNDDDDDDESAPSPNIVNAKDCRHNTALHYAVVSPQNSPAIVRWLLEHGADVNAENAVGQTPLLAAVSQESSLSLEICNMLVDAGARVGQAPLLKALVRDDTDGDDPNNGNSQQQQELLQCLLRSPTAPVNACLTVAGAACTPLTLAIHRGWFPVVQTLLLHADSSSSSSIDPNQREESSNMTPLHLALRKNRPDIVRLLVQHPRIDLDARDYKNRTPLQLAYQRKNVQCIWALLGTSSSSTSKSNKDFSKRNESSSEEHEGPCFLKFLQAFLPTQTHHSLIV